MGETRELTLLEKRTLICALAQERSNAYAKASDLRDRSAEIEDSGKSGYGALDEEAARYEDLASETDDLIDLLCEGRIVVLRKGDV